MRLIDVNAILTLEKNVEEGQGPDCTKKVLVELYGPKLANTKYAILSHYWGVQEEGQEEVEFTEMMALPAGEHERNEIRGRSGYKKILKACKQAHNDQLNWVWIDTCCINKESSSELSEAINSMYQWYAGAEQCYAYLHDVDGPTFPTERDIKRFTEFNGWPKWFSRGWTLQELVAPYVVKFFNSKWEFLGDKKVLSICRALTSITHIPQDILKDGLSPVDPRPCIAQIMSWAAGRRTTREEDRAYSLLGLFGVHMPLLYGEGKNAFLRLQEEIIRRSDDQSIFAWEWRRKTGWSSTFLADDPSCFEDCNTLTRMQHSEFIKRISNEKGTYNVGNPEIRTFSLHNSGIRMWLYLTPAIDSPRLFTARLACSSPSHPVITIQVVLFEYTYFRYFNEDTTTSHWGEGRFQCVFLSYREKVDQSGFTSGLDLTSLFHDGFVVKHVFPSNVLSRNSLRLSTVDDCAVSVYYHNEDDLCFAIALQYCFGQHWINFVWELPHWQFCDSSYWWNYIETHKRARKEGLDIALRFAEERLTAGPGHRSFSTSAVCLGHFHIPRSIQGINVFYRRVSRPWNGCVVEMCMTRCPGCCPSGWMSPNSKSRLHIRHLIPDIWPWYNLVDFRQNSVVTGFYLSVPQIKLGDFGQRQFPGGPLCREGNIFDLAMELDLVTTSLASKNVPLHSINPKNDYLKFNISTEQCSKTFALREPVYCTLPRNGDIFTLLKVLSTRLPGRSLVTTLVQCSECYVTENELVPRAWPTNDVDNSARDPRIGWVRLNTTVTFYRKVLPLVWWLSSVDFVERKTFKEIRVHFCTLLGMEDSSNKMKGAITKDPDGVFLLDWDLYSSEYLGPLVRIFAQGILPGLDKKQASCHVDDKPSNTHPFLEGLLSIIASVNADSETQSEMGHITLDKLDTFSLSYTIRTFLENKLDSSCRPSPTLFHLSDMGNSSLIKCLATGLIDYFLAEQSHMNNHDVFQASTEVKAWDIALAIRRMTFGLELLRVFGAAYVDAHEIYLLYESGVSEEDIQTGLHYALASLQSQNTRLMRSDGRPTIHTLVRDIKALRETLDRVRDDNENLALEEDIIGKILLASWMVFRTEVEKLLAQVVVCTVRHIMDDKAQTERQRDQIIRLREVGEIFMRAAEERLDDVHCPFRRIMADAQCTSKYQLLLDAYDAAVPKKILRNSRDQMCS